MKTAVRGFLLLFGLILLPGAAGAQEWVQLRTRGAAPPHRSRATAVYDPQGHRLVVFGGISPMGNLNAVWALDLCTLEWADLTPPTDAPAAPGPQRGIRPRATKGS